MIGRSYISRITGAATLDAAAPDASPAARSVSLPAGLEFAPVATFVAGAVIIVSFQSFGGVTFFRDHLDGRFDALGFAGMHDYLYWFASSGLWLFVLPVALIAAAPGMRLRDFGLGLGDWRFGVRTAALLYAAMLPVVIAVSFRDNFIDYYPMSDWVRGEVRAYHDGGAASHLWAFAVYEMAYAAYFIGWEFFHRGFLTIGLSRALGWYAVLVVSIPFAILHVDKPMPEAYGAIGASLILGWLAIRTRSSWYGFALHASVAVTMDVLAVAHQVA